MLIGLRGLGLVFLTEILSSDEWSLAKKFGDWSLRFQCRFAEALRRIILGAAGEGFLYGFSVGLRYGAGLVIFYCFTAYMQKTLCCSVL